MKPGQKRCDGITKLGEPCRRTALPGMDHCIMHVPEDQVSEAEKFGFHRCEARVHDKDNPRLGERCAQEAIPGTSRCEYHQDKTQHPYQHVSDDEKIRATTTAIVKIHKITDKDGIDTSAVVNPLQALLELTAEAHGFKEELRRRVVALGINEWRYENIAGEQIRGDILLYERAMDRVARMLVMVTKLGIEDRLARIAQRQAILIEQAITIALEESGATPSQQDTARISVSRQLRAVK